MSLIKNVNRLSQMYVRHLSTTSRVAADEVHPGYARIKEIQKRFQKPDGLPVHLKGGIVDQIMYRFTMGLCVVAVILMGDLYYELACPPTIAEEE